MGQYCFVFEKIIAVVLTPVQHFEICKRASEHGVTAALKTAQENTCTRSYMQWNCFNTP